MFITVFMLDTYYVEAKTYGIYSVYLVPKVIGFITKGFKISFRRCKSIPIRDRVRTCNLLELEV